MDFSFIWTILFQYFCYMAFCFMDFSLIWTILFQYFGYMTFCFMDFSLIWIILAGTNVVHIKVYMITIELDFDWFSIILAISID